ncbi:low-temperature-induced 65 kDa protein-like protein [Tanacetum coccineum]
MAMHPRPCLPPLFVDQVKISSTFKFVQQKLAEKIYVPFSLFVYSGNTGQGFTPHVISAGEVHLIVFLFIRSRAQRLQISVGMAEKSAPAYEQGWLLFEPTTTALSYGLNNKEGIIIVFDLGGDAFDVSGLAISNGNSEVAFWESLNGLDDNRKDCLRDVELHIKVQPGKNVGIGKDYTIFTLIDGLLEFEKYNDNRSGMNMDYYDLPSSGQNPDRARELLKYDPNALSLMPERPIEERYIGYDPVLDYGMQLAKNGGALLHVRKRAKVKLIRADPSNKNSSYAHRITSATSAITCKAATVKESIVGTLSHSGDNKSATKDYVHKVADTVTGTISLVYEKVMGACSTVMLKMHGSGHDETTGSPRMASLGTSKGSGVKKYLIESLKPGDDDKVLSEMITNSLHRKKANTKPTPQETITIKHGDDDEKLPEVVKNALQKGEVDTQQKVITTLEGETTIITTTTYGKCVINDEEGERRLQENQTASAFLSVGSVKMGNRSLQSRTEHSGTSPHNELGTLQSRAKHLGSRQSNSANLNYMPSVDCDERSMLPAS